MTMEEEQAALSRPRIDGLSTAGLLPREYRQLWATRMNALGTIFVCQAGPSQFIAALFLGESMTCHFASQEMPHIDEVRASVERDVGDPKFGRAWAGEWISITHGAKPDFKFTQR